VEAATGAVRFGANGVFIATHANPLDNIARRSMDGLVTTMIANAKPKAIQVVNHVLRRHRVGVCSRRMIDDRFETSWLRTAGASTDAAISGEGTDRGSSASYPGAARNSRIGVTGTTIGAPLDGGASETNPADADISPIGVTAMRIGPLLAGGADSPEAVPALPRPGVTLGVSTRESYSDVGTTCDGSTEA